MSTFTMTDYEDSDCPLFKSMQKHHPLFGITFQKIYTASNGDVCFECGYKLTKECKGIARFNRDTDTAKIICYKKTNAELSKILNCSKRQVAKMRKSKTLPKKYQ